MTRHEALMLMGDKGIELDDREFQCALPPLHEQDFTWGERTVELLERVRALGFMAPPPSMDVLASLGAHVVAFMRAVGVAEQVDVSAGDAA